jgi:hypothetical protein
LSMACTKTGSAGFWILNIFVTSSQTNK